MDLHSALQSRQSTVNSPEPRPNPELRIGALTLDTPVLAAPIAGFTDQIFRRVVRELGGCGLMFTEMIWAKGWIEGKFEPARLDGVKEEQKPLGVQLWDREEKWLEEAARRLVALDVSVIDLNFGCPKKRIMGRHACGAALLRDPLTVGRLVAATVRGAGRVPVTAKMRLGPSLQAPTAPDVARAAAENGAAAITVHGRCADQHYGEPSVPEKIAQVVDAVSVPVIANGDIRDAASALHAIDVSGAAGVMVAREAIVRPWVFREITAALRGEPLPTTPTLAEQKAQLLRHHAAMVELHGDPHGTVVMRKFACRYFIGQHGNSAFRGEISRAASTRDFTAIVERFVADDSVEESNGRQVEESKSRRVQQSKSDGELSPSFDS
ncbi:MAG TPA: tRNA-dihydrouridine synthase [Candidatus Acidoferrales bacterium]|nr:tRNA-dihydrouridine synthase [Candidatus Acidoferrales bacterium]